MIELIAALYGLGVVLTVFLGSYVIGVTNKVVLERTGDAWLGLVVCTILWPLMLPAILGYVIGAERKSK